MEINQGLLVSSLLEAGFPVYPINPNSLPGAGKRQGPQEVWLRDKAEFAKAVFRPLQACSVAPFRPAVALINQQRVLAPADNVLGFRRSTFGNTARGPTGSVYSRP